MKKNNSSQKLRKYGMWPVVVLMGMCMSCATSSESLGERAPLPVVVEVDGEIQSTRKHVWIRDSESANRKHSDALKVENGPTYDQSQQEWFGQDKGQNVRIIIDEDQRWWNGAGEGMQGFKELREKYKGVNSVPLARCDVEKDCDITLRVRKEPTQVDNLEKALWHDWYEVRTTIPSHVKEYEEALQKDPKASGYAYIQINFEDDEVTAEYVREGYVDSRELVETYPVDDKE